MSEAIHSDERELKHRFNETRLPDIQLRMRVQRKLTGDTNHRSSPSWFKRKAEVALCSFIVIAVAAGALSTFPASADKLRRIPVVGHLFSGNIFSFAGDSGVISGQKTGLTHALNQEARDQGVAIKLQDALYDGARLVIGYEIQSDEPNRLLFLGDVEIAVNGKSYSMPTVNSSPHLIDDRHTVGTMTFDLGADIGTAPIHLVLRIGEISSTLAADAGRPLTIAGDWNFAFDVANNTSDSAYYAMHGQTAVSMDGKLQLIGYLSTQATFKLDFRYSGDTEWLGFQVRDDRGMLIEKLDTQFSTDKDGVSTGSVRFAPLEEGTRVITVTPYNLLVTRNNDEKTTVPLTTAFPITVSQGTVGEAIVHNVDFQPDKTLIRYEVTGRNPFVQKASLWLETADGQMIISDSGTRTRISDTSYTYLLEYPALDPAESYLIGTMPQTDMRLQDASAVTVDIAQ